MTRQEHIESYRICVEKMHESVDADLVVLSTGKVPERSGTDIGTAAFEHLKAAMATPGIMKELAKVIEREKEYVAKLARSMAMVRLIMVQQGHMPNFGPDDKTVH